MDMSGVSGKLKLSRIFAAGLNPAKPDFSGWLRLSKISAG